MAQWGPALALLVSLQSVPDDKVDPELEQTLKKAMIDSDMDFSPPAMLIHVYNTHVPSAHVTHALVYRASSLSTKVRLLLKQHFLQLEYTQLAFREAMLSAIRYVAHVRGAVRAEARRVGASMRAADLEALAIHACEQSRRGDPYTSVDPDYAMLLFYYAVKRDHPDLFKCEWKGSAMYMYAADGTPVLHSRNSVTRRMSVGAVLTDDEPVSNIEHSCTFTLGGVLRMLCVNPEGEGMELVLSKNPSTLHMDGTVVKHFKLTPVEGKVTGLAVSTGTLSWTTDGGKSCEVRIYVDEAGEIVFEEPSSSPPIS